MRYVLLLATACGRIGCDSAPDDGVRREIRFAAPGTEVSDFVAGLQLDLGPASARKDGADIYFVADTGERLAFEIESWRFEDAHLLAWVRVPSIAAQTPTSIFVHYGSGRPVEHDPREVWDGIAASVWHLTEDDAPFRDSARPGNHAGVLEGSPLPVRGTGIAGNCATFDGSAQLLVGDPADDSLDFGTDSFSYEVWVRVTQSLGDFDTVFWKGGSSVINPGYDLELGTNEWSFVLNDGALGVYLALGDEPEFLGGWVQLTAVVDRGLGFAIGYVNGEETTRRSITALGSLSNASTLILGRHDYPFLGDLDEVRVYPGALSPAWIALSNAMLARPADAYTVGDEEQVTDTLTMSGG